MWVVRVRLFDGLFVYAVSFYCIVPKSLALVCLCSMQHNNILVGFEDSVLCEL